MGDPEQTDWSAGLLVTTFEFEFTVTVAVMAVPGQPLAVGVMVNVTVTGEPVVLVKVPVILAEVPLEAIPVTEPVLFLVQEYVVLLAELLTAMGIMAAPEQIV